MPTPYHAKYFAHDLTIQKPLDGVERISRSLIWLTLQLFVTI